MTWWPILEDPVGIAGDHSLHAVDMYAERNKDRRPPVVARCGVVLWKVYGVGVKGGGTMVMPWPPKVSVARAEYGAATVCEDCRRLATPKRPLASWNNVVQASEGVPRDGTEKYEL